MTPVYVDVKPPSKSP